MNCDKHPETKLICPKCIGGKGAEATNAKHGSKLSEWGKRGGLAKKKHAENGCSCESCAKVRAVKEAGKIPR